MYMAYCLIVTKLVMVILSQLRTYPLYKALCMSIQLHNGSALPHLAVFFMK